MRKRVGESEGTASWIDQELAGCEFADVRLGKRFKILVERLSEGVGESIPMACQDWAGTKAAYRFFSNDRVSEAEILSGHFQATRDRFQATPGTVLVLHDTTELSFQREKKQAIGVTCRPYGGKGQDGRPRLHTVCGILLHSSLVVTLEGLPLGIAAVKAWTRKKFKGCNALKKKINPTRVPIEEKESVRWLENLRQSTALLNDPERCVHIGDRESDIYELFCEAQHIGTHFLVRTCVDRLAGDGTHTIADEMSEVRVKGLHRIEVRDAKGDRSEAILEIRYRRIRVLPPIGKQQRYPETTLHVIHAQERGTPKGRARIEWKLITDLPVTSRAEAIEKLTWYASRWKIETFHKILKSGCKAEDSKLRTAERLLRLIAVFCVLSWRIFWMTMINDPPQARRRRPFSRPSSVGCSITWCRIEKQTAPEGNPFPHISPKWPGSAAILPERVIRRLATSSCGEGYPDSPISNWDLAWRSLWVIERWRNPPRQGRRAGTNHEGESPSAFWVTLAGCRSDRVA